MNEEPASQEQGVAEENDATETCLVPGCPTADLSQLSRYHQRHRVCQFHLKATVVQLDGCDHRFCQQCGRFQPLADFRDDRRSCKAALRAHNARRRHSSMASDNAVYQGRFRSSKRSLPREASRGASGSAGRRCLEGSAASVSSNSYNSAPALLQRYGESSSQRLRPSSDWAATFDGNSTGEQDKGLSDSQDDSYASAASEDEESPQPRRRARTKQQSQRAQRGRPCKQPAVAQHFDQHSIQQQMVMMMHMPMGYTQQHSMQDWHSGAYSPAAMQYPYQSSYGAVGCADPSSMMQHGESSHMLPGAQHNLAAGYAGQAAAHDRSRLGQTAGEPLGVVSAGSPAAVPVAGWQQGYAGSAHQMAAPAGAAPGWQQQGSPPARQQQLSTQGLPAAAGMPPAWHGTPAVGSQEFKPAGQLQDYGMQEYKPAVQLQDYKPAVPSTWQCSSMSTPAQQLLSAVSTQGCAAVGAVPGWQQQQQQQEYAVAAQQSMPSSTTHAFPGAANSGNNYQLGSMAAAQQLAAAGTQGYAAPGMAHDWQQAGSTVQPQQRTGSCSVPMPMQLPPPMAHSAGLPASAQGGNVPLTVKLWNFAGGIRGNTLLQQNAQHVQTQQHAQPQQSTIGQIGWPAAASQPSFPQAPVQPRVQAASAPPAQHQVGGPSASFTYLHGVMAAQAAPMQQQQQGVAGCGLLQQQVPAASGAEQDGSTQTLCSQGQQIVPPEPAQPLQQQHNNRPDWLDMLACSEDMDGADDVARMCQSPEAAAPAASTAPHAHAAHVLGSMLQEGLLSTALAAALAVGAAGASTDIGRCISPGGLLDGVEDAGDGDLPSEEVDALLDQALDDLFHVHPGRGLPVCCSGSPMAADDPAGWAESLPCTSTTCDGQV